MIKGRKTYLEMTDAIQKVQCAIKYVWNIYFLRGSTISYYHNKNDFVGQSVFASCPLRKTLKTIWGNFSQKHQISFRGLKNYQENGFQICVSHLYLVIIQKCIHTMRRKSFSRRNGEKKISKKLLWCIKLCNDCKWRILHLIESRKL